MQAIIAAPYVSDGQWGCGILFVKCIAYLWDPNISVIVALTISDGGRGTLGCRASVGVGVNKRRGWYDSQKLKKIELSKNMS